MTIDTIRLSEKGKQQLVKLKQRTGIKNWNVLCRWAFCTSLAESSIPPYEDIPADSSVEMTWKVFGGQSSDAYLAILCERAASDSCDDLNRVFRTHLHRGFSYLMERLLNISSIS